MTLADAREQAAKIMRERGQGIDVVGNRRAEKRKRRAEITQPAETGFGALLREYVEDIRGDTRGWRASARQLGLDYSKEGDEEPTVIKGGLASLWESKLGRDITADDVFDEVDAARLHGVPGLTALNRRASDSRGRLFRAALSSFFTWCWRRRKIKKNPCRDVPPPQSVKSRDRVLDDYEVKLMWAACDQLGEPFGAVFKLLLLTGQRRDARRSELGSGDAIALPGERTKNKRKHLVPLSDPAKDVLIGVWRIEGRYLFCTTGRSPVSGWSRVKRRLDKIMIEIARRDDPKFALTAWRIHDLRRTCETGMARLKVLPDIRDMVLNHISGAKPGVRAAYDMYDYYDEKREALEKRGAYVVSVTSGRPANVTLIDEARERLR
jgi:integrase